jgi:K+-transporting ATPase KdpF subunit
LLSGLRQGRNQMFEYVLGAAAVVIIVVYLVYALMRPEQF